MCASFWLSSLFTKATSGKSLTFYSKSKPFSHSPRVSFDISMYLIDRRNSELKDLLKVHVCIKTCLMSAHRHAIFLCSVDDNLVGQLTANMMNVHHMMRVHHMLRVQHLMRVHHMMCVPQNQHTLAIDFTFFLIFFLFLVK